MTFETWQAARGIDPAKLTDAERAVLKAAYDHDVKEGRAGDPDRRLEDVMAKSRQEAERRDTIAGMVQAQLTPGTPRHLVDRVGEVGRLAIEGGWDVQRTELEILRVVRAGAVQTYVAPEQAPDSEVVEAAFCSSAGLPDVERHFPANVLEAARKKWKYGCGLAELVLSSARRNGYRGYNMRDTSAVLRAAFAPVEIRAAEQGPSTYSLPQTMANIANKFVKVGWQGVDDAWRQIAARRTVSDFKTVTTISLTGGMVYVKVPPGGEIKHGTAGELTYTNKADTYARMFGIDRRDLINDDANVLSSASRRLGRGGALKINDVFWSTFLNNSSFFTSGNLNVSTGAGSALAIAGLNAAYSTFLKQTDPDGLPVAINPTIMLVPPTLYPTALTLNQSTAVVGSTSQPNANVWQGRFKPVTSPYMENTSYTGNSNAAWYLLANPDDMAVIEVCFLNGQEMPTVETAELEFNQLGISMRGYHDWGVSLQEYRAGVRSAGS